MSGAQNRARIEAYIGASGSGKGASIGRRLDELRPARLLVWDPRDEYGRHAPRAASLPDAVGKFRDAGPGPVRVRYVPGSSIKPADAFALLCRLAFEAGSLVYVAEELSDVTTPGWAPPAWRQLVTQGRHRALHVIAAAQRPALIDKSFLGNATFVRCFALRYRGDQATMADLLGVPLSTVAELRTEERAGSTVVRYVERDFKGGAAVAGSFTLRRRA